MVYRNPTVAIGTEGQVRACRQGKTIISNNTSARIYHFIYKDRVCRARSTFSHTATSYCWTVQKTPKTDRRTYASLIMYIQQGLTISALSRLSSPPDIKIRGTCCSATNMIKRRITGAPCQRLRSCGSGTITIPNLAV